MADWFSSQGIEGYTPPGVAGGDPNYNPNTAPGPSGFDPFSYTNGSLLTPWTERFQAPPGSSGGYSAPAYVPFGFGDFNYKFTQPGAYGGQQDLASPGNFQYGAFSGAPAFTGVSAQDLQGDPSYQFRLQQGQGALENSAAAKGLLRSGDTAKALVDYGQNAASQEYQNVYARKAAEHDRAQQEAMAGYSTNRSNVAENFDRNAKNAQIVNAANNASRLAGYQASSDVALKGGQLGYDIATGTYDRNYAKARQLYEDQRAAAAAAAGAGSANANQSYNRALDEYRMNYGIFQTNQQNQFDRALTLAQLGMQGAGAQAGYGNAYSNNMSDLYNGQAGANAAGQLASGNAWGNALAGIGNAAGTAYVMTRPRTPNLPSFNVTG